MALTVDDKNKKIGGQQDMIEKFRELQAAAAAQRAAYSQAVSGNSGGGSNIDDTTIGRALAGNGKLSSEGVSGGYSAAANSPGATSSASGIQADGAPDPNQPVTEAPVTGVGSGTQVTSSGLTPSNNTDNQNGSHDPAKKQRQEQARQSSFNALMNIQYQLNDLNNQISSTFENSELTALLTGGSQQQGTEGVGTGGEADNNNDMGGSPMDKGNANGSGNVDNKNDLANGQVRDTSDEDKPSTEQETLKQDEQRQLVAAQQAAQKEVTEGLREAQMVA